MSYSGASTAKTARESLGAALGALQQDPNIPEPVLAVAQNVAQAVGALFEAENATSELDGKTCVRNALGSLSQTLALLQDVRTEHKGIETATATIAQAMSALHPLTTIPSRMPPPKAASAPPAAAPAPAAVPAAANQPRMELEANIGATTQSNFYVGFSGEISEGGVFMATYETLSVGTPVRLLITLPGGFEARVDGQVRFVRDPLDFTADSEPGMGIQFANLPAESRELILRFIKKRPTVFYDA